MVKQLIEQTCNEIVFLWISESFNSARTGQFLSVADTKWLVPDLLDETDRLTDHWPADSIGHLIISNKDLCVTSEHNWRVRPDCVGTDRPVSIWELRLISINKLFKKK